MRKMRRKYTEGSGLITQLLSARFTLLEKWLPTNQRTNQQTDRQMDKASYRGAWTHLKILYEKCILALTRLLIVI